MMTIDAIKLLFIDQIMCVFVYLFINYNKIIYTVDTKTTKFFVY